MSEYLVECGLHVGHLLLVLQRREPAPAHDVVHLLLQLLLDVGTVDHVKLKKEKKEIHSDIRLTKHVVHNKRSFTSRKVSDVLVVSDPARNRSNIELT